VSPDRRSNTRAPKLHEQRRFEGCSTWGITVLHARAIGYRGFARSNGRSVAFLPAGVGLTAGSTTPLDR
jgi:hypothetical protein